jgi:hypothetical protein
MDAFDAISAIGEVAIEWRTTDQSGGLTNAPFEKSISRVTSCYEDLELAALGGNQEARRIVAQALREAIRQVDSVELSVDDLLAIRDERARVVLSALQLVRNTQIEI